ncbi:MarR family winged helix-turn-helix transcriptional regulator [Novosphingobium sp.]|uniref:MarR family winged helix-turn-helix transcriptional regulator n=1 Tax=Novosphingobium sp. TaxID=1874826 RepID=UPI003BAA02BA
MPERPAPLDDADYVALASFRHALRSFLAFSEARAQEVGLTPQQHQALLAIRAADPGRATVGYVAERLILKPHSATGLIDRLEALGLVTRETGAGDRRRALLRLTGKAYRLLEDLSAVHRDEIQRLRPVLVEILGSLA